jgi:predicted HNH restriction endonuclease
MTAPTPEEVDKLKEQEHERIVEAFLLSSQEYKDKLEEMLKQQILNKMQQNPTLTYEQAKADVRVENQEHYFEEIDGVIKKSIAKGQLTELTGVMLHLREKYPQSANVLRLAKDVDQAIRRYLEEKQRLEE